jgi:predicted nuclease with TOPRIM domain
VGVGGLMVLAWCLKGELDRSEASLGEFKIEMAGKFNTMDVKFKSIAEKFDIINEENKAINRAFNTIDEKVNNINERFKATNQKFNTIDEKIAKSMETAVKVSTENYSRLHDKSGAKSSPPKNDRE